MLNELGNVARRKMRLCWVETHALPGILRALLVVHPVTVETHEMGLAQAERYGLSIYDAMIVAAAVLAGCDELVSEDRLDGMVTAEGARVVDPFGREPMATERSD